MEFNRLKAELSDQLSQGRSLGREGLSQGLPPSKQIGTRSEVLSKDKQKLIYREDTKQADNNYKKGVTMKQGDRQSIKTSQKKGSPQGISFYLAQVKEKTKDGKRPTELEKKDINKATLMKLQELKEASLENNRFYSMSDLLYSIFCCLKSRSQNKASAYNRYKFFCSDSAKFEHERDLVSVVSKMNMIQNRITNLEEAMNKIGVSETVEPPTAQLVGVPNLVDLPAYVSSLPPVPSAEPFKVAPPKSTLVQENVEEAKNQSFKAASKDVEPMKEEMTKDAPAATKKEDDWNPKPIDFKAQMDILSKARKK